MSKCKMTEKRTAILKEAVKHPLGIVERPYFQEFSRIAWDNNAAALTRAGLLAPYVHGGYEITAEGRAVLENGNG